MKKILFVIPTMRMGGAEQSLVSLLNLLDKEQYEIDLLLFEKKGELLENISEKVNILETDLVTTGLLLEFRYYFKALLKEKKIAAVLLRLLILLISRIQIVLNRNIILSWNLSKYLIKPQEKQYDVAIGYLEGAADFYVIDKVDAKRKIGWIHSDFLKQQRNYKAEYKYYRQFDKIVVISEICKANFLKYDPKMESKTVVIENISNYEWIHQKSLEAIPEKLEKDTFYIISVGRLEEVKGFDLAISAAALLKNRNKKFVWHIFGEGSYRKKLQRQIEQLGIEDVITLKGTTSNPYSYMRCADLIVQSSRYEGKSIVLDEAKLFGKPIVVTNYSSAKDQIEHAKDGWIVEMDPESIADGIEFLMENQQLRVEIGDQCLKNVLTKQNSLNKIENIMQN